MTVAARRAPVVEFPVPVGPGMSALQPVIDVLREALGRVTSLVDVLLQLDAAGLALTAASGAGTLVAGSGVSLDFEDGKLDSFRVAVYGSSTASSCDVVVQDVTDSPSVELCRVTLPTVAGRVVGVWTQLAKRPQGARSIEARVIGTGAANQVLTNVHLHARTTHFR